MDNELLKRNIGRFVLFAVPITFGVFACFMPLAFVVLASQINSILPPGWHSLGTLPEEATQIIAIYPEKKGGTQAAIYVETISGKVFLCCRQGVQWQETSWPVTPTQTLVSPGGFHRLLRPYDTSKYRDLVGLPARVKDYATMVWSWEWADDETQVALLDNNSIWQWRRNNSDLALILFSLAGIGSIACLVILGKPWVMRFLGKVHG